MARVARRVHDKRLLRLIRLYLKAGVMEGGLVAASEEGTPQGSPRSAAAIERHARRPRLEAEKRGHRFVRADDGRIYVCCRRADERVMASITPCIEQRLKLRVNRGKSMVDRATKRPLLGFRFSYRGDQVRPLVDPSASNAPRTACAC
jgi:RNA-directed DNA polymerase